MLLCPLVGTEAAYVGTVRYGSFEEAKRAGAVPTGWNAYSTCPWYGNFETSTDYASDGLYSLKTVAPQNAGIAQANISGTLYWGYFDTNAKYELSVKVLVPESSSVRGALLRVRVYNENGTVADVYTPTAERITGDTGGEWKTVRTVFTPKRNFGAIETVYIRCNEGVSGTAYWDEMQLHKLNADGSYADKETENTLPSGTDVMQNGDFSSLLSTTRPNKWTSSGTWGKESVLVPNADGEKTAVKLSGSGAPYITQSFNVAGGETYTIKGRLRSDGGTPVIKFSYHGAGEFTTESFGDTNGKWRDFTYDFTVPDGVTSLSLLFRKYGEADVYYASLQLLKTAEAPLLTLKTDNDTTFYYGAWKTGDASVTLNCTPATGETVRFYIWDGERKTDVQSVAAKKNTSFTFSVKDKTRAKKYTLRAELVSKDGKTRGTAEKEIYVFDRPSAINENGRMRNPDGTYSDVVFGYHVYKEDMQDARALGVNVIQGMGDYESDSIGDFLDAAEKAGLRVLVPLYSGNMLPAGHYVNRERTEAIISAYKNHPALFGWMIQDEPFLQNRNNPEEVRKQLLESYLLIRTLDKDHPTFMTADCYSAEHYADIGNACDIIAPDQYPIGSGQNVTDVYANMAAVNRAVRGRKPVYALLQTFSYAGSRQPTIDELMHMIYQSFFAGADAVGFYSFRESDWLFKDTVLYTDLVAANPEIREAYSMFQRTDLTENQGADGLLWCAFSDGECIAINQGNAAVTKEVENIKLAFGNGSLKKDGENVLLSLPNIGRAIGKKGTVSFPSAVFFDAEGNRLDTIKKGEITVQISLMGKAILPEGSYLFVTRRQEKDGICELLDSEVCKTETDGAHEIKITAQGIPGEKIEVFVRTPFGQPIYHKAVLQ